MGGACGFGMWGSGGGRKQVLELVGFCGCGGCGGCGVVGSNGMMEEEFYGRRIRYHHTYAGWLARLGIIIPYGRAGHY